MKSQARISRRAGISRSRGSLLDHSVGDIEGRRADFGLPCVSSDEPASNIISIP